MARTVDQVAHAHHREEILDAAQRLIQAKGFVRMSVQDLLDELQISKGAFYHYFDSKPALLDALVERQADRLHAHLADGPRQLPDFFGALAEWKLARKADLVALLQVWFSDDNAVVRQRMRARITERVVPLLAEILHDEQHPEQTARVAVTLIQSLNDVLGELFLAQRLDAVDDAVAAHTQALERILGLAPGSLELVDMARLRAWLGQE